MKEEHTNEFLAACYGAYIGNNIIMPKSGRIAKLQGIDFDGETIHLNDGEDHRDFKYFPFKLILTPLSEISDEDAIEVAKILNSIKDIGHAKNYYLLYGKDYIEDTSIGSFKTSVSDFLRSRGYDCGFRHIPSLIEAAIAIRKE